MPWMRKDPDPLEARRRQLADAERALAEQRRRLNAQINGTAGAKPMEPPVWRMEEDAPDRAPELTPARRRHLARQRQRDMVLCIIFAIVLLIVLVAIYFIGFSHGASASASA